MSENTDDKTKRKYLALLTENQWSHRYSVYYADPAMSKSLLTDMVEFKQALRKRYSDQPFLIRIQTKVGGLNDKTTLQAYLTILTTSSSEGLKVVAHDTFSSEVNIQRGKLSTAKLESIASAIDKQRPHDLSKVFGDVRVRRYSVLNKEMLKPL
ncbi:hypothetical protein G9Q84_20510 [Pseudomonas sp. P7]|uniref:hypothetical protein n=1 Tax=Pseudomonas sivasensis TaxID=1880678 RepID=UPI0015EC8629|nr:hypothetical protein [Pseudomonas sivasensis]MBA2925267.1 hypothetical protein [Pseudomonas sivasensis]